MSVRKVRDMLVNKSIRAIKGIKDTSNASPSIGIQRCQLKSFVKTECVE